MMTNVVDKSSVRDTDEQVKKTTSIVVNIDESANDDNEHGKFIPVEYKKKKTRKITVLGDSTVKDIKPWKIKLDKKLDQLTVKCFGWATIEDMMDYARPTVRKNPDLILLHAGTNELSSKKTVNNISSDIMKLALELKMEGGMT